MYPAKLEIKDTTESISSASYLDFLLSIGRDGQLYTSIYDKRDNFNFHITNFPFLSSNISSSLVFFISQLIRYARTCSSYECFIGKARRLFSKLFIQGYFVECLKSSFMKFYGNLWSYSAIWSIPLKNVEWHSDPRPATVTSIPIRLYTNFMTLIPSLTFDQFQVVSMEHLQRMWHAIRERLPLCTPGSVPFRNCLWSNVWDQFLRTCRVFFQLITLDTQYCFYGFRKYNHVTSYILQRILHVYLTCVQLKSKIEFHMDQEVLTELYLLYTCEYHPSFKLKCDIYIYSRAMNKLWSAE